MTNFFSDNASKYGLTKEVKIIADGISFTSVRRFCKLLLEDKGINISETLKRELIMVVKKGEKQFEKIVWKTNSGHMVVIAKSEDIIPYYAILFGIDVSENFYSHIKDILDNTMR